MAFARLVLSGTMTDRDAAQAAGLNHDTAAYTKAKPGVRAYMVEHRAAVREKLVDQRAEESLCKLNIGRDQVLDRLWELATLSSEATRGTIGGQLKALAMIAAIEGLIPDRRLSASGTKPTAQPIIADIYQSEWLRNPQGQSVGEQTGNPVVVPEPQPVPEPVTDSAKQASAPNLDPHQSSIAHPSINPGRQNWVPAAADSGLDAFLATTHSPRQLFSLTRRFSGRRR
jgi:hypothetical protein